VTVVGVVIPARDEGERITACLESVVAAVRSARVWTTRVVVVADRCRDDTAAAARRVRGVEVIDTDAGSVGAARRLGSDAALDLGADWLAHTDADSLVPARWIAHQLDLAAQGVDVMIGTVRPMFSELPPGFEEIWRRDHVRGRPNGHVHGANLGVRASAYRSAGGFDDADTEHEDTRLVDRLIAMGANVVPSDTAEVVTSGRRFGRTPGGYAGFLRGELTRLELRRDTA
jgi:glycosyltransferase involved in cell wall biosynthesis